MRKALLVLAFLLAGSISAQSIFIGVVAAQDTTSITPNPPVELLAFPGAEGHGKNATGGRGGVVLEVTNLNDSGSGSFRTALTTVGDRTVVFATTGGTITLLSPIVVTEGNLTIAGETAPGDGIAIYGKSVQFNDCSNVIITEIRFRGGDTSSDDALRLNQTNTNGIMSDFIFDQCTFSWGADENFGAGGGRGNDGITRVTISNSIISESFNDKGMLMFHETTKFSFLRNLFANQQDRNIHPSTETSSFEFANNVVYNFEFGTHPTVLNTHDIIGNIYLDGPSTALEVIKLQGCLNNCDPDINSGAGTNWFVDDNTFNGGDADGVGGRYNDQAESSTPVLSSGYIALANAVVQDSVLTFSGARARMEGVDALDAHMIADVVNGTTGAFVTMESQTTGLPTLTAGTVFTDADADKMWDVAEIAIWGNITTTNDPNGDEDGDGYTDLDETFQHFRGQQ